MKPHEERVIAERNELSERLFKLASFIEDNPIFKSLSTVEQTLLHKQYQAMDAYDNILKERIDLFNPPPGHQ